MTTTEIVLLITYGTTAVSVAYLLTKIHALKAQIDDLETRVHLTFQRVQEIIEFIKNSRP